MCAACFSPFADESEAEEEVSRGIMSCLLQFSALDVPKEYIQLSFLTHVSVHSKMASTLPEVPLDNSRMSC